MQPTVPLVVRENADTNEKNNYRLILKNTKLIQGMSSAFQALGVSANVANVAIKAFSGLIVALATLIGTQIIKAIDNYIHRVEIARDTLQETTSELQEIEDELKSVARQIDEILAKDKIDPTDKNALKRLQLENDELERRKILLEAQQERNASNLNAKIEDEYSKEYQDSDIRIGDNTFTKEEYIDQLISRYNELLGLQRELTDEEKAEAEEIRNAMVEEGNNLAKMTEGYTPITQKQKEIKAGWEEMIAEAARVAETYPGTAIDVARRLADKFAHGAMWGDESTFISAAGADKQIAAWINSLSDEEKRIMVECHLEEASLDELKAYLAEQLNVDIPEVSFSDIFKLEDTDLGSISESIDKIQNAYTTLNDAINEYNESGYLTIDTIQEITALGSGYLDFLVDEEGNLRLDKEALQELTVARLRDMQAQMQQELFSQVDKIKSETDANKFAAQSYREKAESIDMVTAAMLKNRITELDISDSAKNNVLNAASKQLTQINALFDNAIAGVYTNPDTTIGGSGSSKKDFKKTYDWVEKAISRIEHTIDRLNNKVTATYRKWSTRNNALAEEMSAITQEIDLQKQAYSTYMGKAEGLDLSDHYKEMIRNGSMSVEDVHDEDLAELIDQYSEYYEKALACQTAVDELRAKQAELAMTKFDNISKQYNDRIALIDHYTNMLEGYVSQSEAAGHWASEVYYQEMAEKELENIVQLQSQYDDLITQFNENVNSGYIKKYSEEWYNMYKSIDEVEEALQAANTALIEYNQTLQQVRWDLFDRTTNYKNDLSEEANFLIDLLDNYDLYHKNGSLTNQGLSVQGLHAMNYNIYMEESEEYAKEIQKINEELANDPNDLELIDRRNELINLQQESIKNAMSEKEAIKDLISGGYDQMLNSLQELIDRRKEALNAEKDLYDYQNTIKEKTDTISNYKKQLQAYTGDNSEEAKATIQKLQLSLEDAEQDLQETEYEKWLSDQESMLDDLYDQTEEWINSRLDQIDGLIFESILATNSNASTISNTLHEVTDAMGYTLSTHMSNIWDAQNTAINSVQGVVKAYGDILYGTQNTINTSINTGITSVQTVLKTIDDDMKKMIEILNAEAKAKADAIAQAQKEAEEDQDDDDDDDDDDWDYTSSSGSGSSSSSSPKKQTTSTKINGAKIVNEDTGEVLLGYKGSDSLEKAEKAMGKFDDALHDPNCEDDSMFSGKLKIETYHSGLKKGLVGKDYSSEDDFELIKQYGLKEYEVPAVLKRGEAVINEGQMSNIANALRNTLIPLNEQMFLSGMVKMPSYSTAQGLHRSGGNVINDINMNITLPNVTDYDSFVTQLKSDRRFEKIVQSMTIDRTMGKNSLSKNRL